MVTQNESCSTEYKQFKSTSQCFGGKMFGLVEGENVIYKYGVRVNEFTKKLNSQAHYTHPTRMN